MIYREVILDGKKVWMRGDRIVAAPVDRLRLKIICSSRAEGDPSSLWAEIIREKTEMKGESAGFVSLRTIWTSSDATLSIAGLKKFITEIEAANKKYLVNS